MTVLKVKLASISHKTGFKLSLLVDKIPSDLTYQKKEIDNERTIYFAEKDGYVRFYLHNKKDETGYCGIVFEFKMKDGTTEKVIGPWSSTASVMMKQGIAHCMEVGLTDDLNAFNGNGCFCNGHVTIDVVDEALRLFGEGVVTLNINGIHDDEFEYKLFKAKIF